MSKECVLYKGIYSNEMVGYTTHKRMVCAAELLGKNELSIIEIAGSRDMRARANLQLPFAGSSV